MAVLGAAALAARAAGYRSVEPSRHVTCEANCDSCGEVIARVSGVDCTPRANDDPFPPSLPGFLAHHAEVDSKTDRNMWKVRPGAQNDCVINVTACLYGAGIGRAQPQSVGPDTLPPVAPLNEDCREKICIPGPCAFLEVDYQNYNINADSLNTDFSLFGMTRCGPTFGRGVTNRLAGDPTVTPVAVGDTMYYPGVAENLTDGYSMIDSTTTPLKSEWKPMWDRAGHCKLPTTAVTDVAQLQHDPAAIALSVTANNPGTAMTACEASVGRQALDDYYVAMVWSSDPAWPVSTDYAAYNKRRPLRVMRHDWSPLVGGVPPCPAPTAKTCGASYCNHKERAGWAIAVCSPGVDGIPLTPPLTRTDDYEPCAEFCEPLQIFPSHSSNFLTFMEVRAEYDFYAGPEVYWASSGSQDNRQGNCESTGGILFLTNSDSSCTATVDMLLRSEIGCGVSPSDPTLQRLVYTLRYAMCTPDSSVMMELCNTGQTFEPPVFKLGGKDFQLAEQACGYAGVTGRPPFTSLSTIGWPHYIKECGAGVTCELMDDSVQDFLRTTGGPGDWTLKSAAPGPTNQTGQYSWICYLTSRCSWTTHQDVSVQTPPWTTADSLEAPEFSLEVFQRPETLLLGRDRTRSGNLPLYPSGRTVENDMSVVTCDGVTYNLNKYGYEQIQTEGFKEYTTVACAIYGYCMGTDQPGTDGNWEPWSSLYNNGTTAPEGGFPAKCCKCVRANYMPPADTSVPVKALDGTVLDINVKHCYAHAQDFNNANHALDPKCVNNAYTAIWHTAVAGDLEKCCPWTNPERIDPNGSAPTGSGCLMSGGELSEFYAANQDELTLCGIVAEVGIDSMIAEHLRGSDVNADVPINPDKVFVLRKSDPTDPQTGVERGTYFRGADGTNGYRSVLLKLGEAGDTHYTQITLLPGAAPAEGLSKGGMGQAENAHSGSGGVDIDAAEIAEWLLPAVARGADFSDPCIRRMAPVSVRLNCTYGPGPIKEGYDSTDIFNINYVKGTAGTLGSTNIGTHCVLHIEAPWDGQQPAPMGCAGFVASGSSVATPPTLINNSENVGPSFKCPQAAVPTDGVGFKPQNPCAPVDIPSCNIVNGVFNLTAAGIASSSSTCIVAAQDKHESLNTDFDGGKNFVCGWRQNWDRVGGKSGFRPTNVESTHAMHHQELGRPECYDQIRSGDGPPSKRKYKEGARWEPVEMFRYCSNKAGDEAHNSMLNKNLPRMATGDLRYTGQVIAGEGNGPEWWHQRYKDHSTGAAETNPRQVVFAKCCQDEQFALQTIDGKRQFYDDNLQKKPKNVDFAMNIQWSFLEYLSGGGACSTEVPQIVKADTQYTQRHYPVDWTKYLTAAGTRPAGEAQYVVESVAWSSIAYAARPGPIATVNRDGTLPPALSDALAGDAVAAAPLRPAVRIKNAPEIPADYSGLPYYTNTKAQDSAFACDCKGAVPVFECERHTPDNMAKLYPGRDWLATGLHNVPSGVDYVRCAWGWDRGVGLGEVVGLFIPSVEASSHFKVIERDWMASRGNAPAPPNGTGPAAPAPPGETSTTTTATTVTTTTATTTTTTGASNDGVTSMADETPAERLARTFLDKAAPAPDRLRALINDQGGAGGDFDPANFVYQGPGVEQPVYHTEFPSGACIRWPYGRVHRHFLKHPTDYFAEPAAGNGGLSVAATEAMYSYCERLDGGKFVYCNHDLLSTLDRQRFCDAHPEADTFTLGIGIGIRTPGDVCTPATAAGTAGTVCVFINGDRNYLSPAAVFDAAVAAGSPAPVTVLVAPFSMRAVLGLQAAVHRYPLTGPAAAKALKHISAATFLKASAAASDAPGLLQVDRDQFLAVAALGQLSRERNATGGGGVDVDTVRQLLNETHAIMAGFSAGAATKAAQAGSAGCLSGVYLGMSTRLADSTVEHWDRYVCGDQADLLPVSPRNVELDTPGAVLESALGGAQPIVFEAAAGACRAVTITAPRVTVGAIRVDNSGCTATGHQAIPVLLGPGDVSGASVDIELPAGAGAPPPVAIAAIGFDEAYPDMGDAVSQVDGGSFVVRYDADAGEPAHLFADVALMRANGTLGVRCYVTAPNANGTTVTQLESCTVLVQDYSPGVTVNATTPDPGPSPTVIDVAALTGAFGYGFEHTVLEVRQRSRSYADAVAAAAFTCTALGVFVG